MKKMIIASLVGALIMFVYQAASWMVIGIHKDSLKIAPNQDSIVAAMNGLEEGVYQMPMLEWNASMDEVNAFHEKYGGKPYAMVQYHESMDIAMAQPMTVGFILDLLVVLLFVWILMKANITGFSRILTWSLIMALIVLLHAPIMQWNWFSTPMHYLKGELIDGLLSWLLAGIWLGWYLSRGTKQTA